MLDSDVEISYKKNMSKRGGTAAIIAQVFAMDRRATSGGEREKLKRMLPRDVQARLNRAEYQHFTAWLSAMTGGDEGLPRDPRKREKAVKRLLYT